MIPLRRRRAPPPPIDFEIGEFVRVVGLRRTGWIESIDGESATVGFDKDKREVWQLTLLRKTNGGGHKFDSRN